jgi:hypothetical protein
MSCVESDPKPKMDLFLAVSIVEGDRDAEDERQVIAAWQYLHDSGAAYQLQGWYGRTTTQLLEQGFIEE